MAAATGNDRKTRQQLLLDLQQELADQGLDAVLRKPRSGIWKLKIRRGPWAETIMCAGAEGAYAFVTVHGRLLGSAGADDFRGTVDLIQFMVNRRQR